MSVFARRAVGKTTGNPQRGFLGEVWKRIAPYLVLDPKHTYSYIMKVRNKQSTGPLGGNLVDGSRQEGYRFPAPGNIEHPSVPDKTSSRNYEITHYTRDTSTTMDPIIILRTDKSSPTAIEGTDYIPLTDGSPGNDNIDVLNYDPSGLRTAMTTTHSALQTSLTSLQPNHLPEDAWAAEAETIVKAYTENGLPPVAGGNFEWNIGDYRHNPQW